LQWVLRTIKALESTNKTFDVVSHFLYPVEELVKAIPDYALIIKQPMDLNIIKNKLTEGEYEDVAQVDSDIKLMIANALKYNPAQDPVHIAANQLQQLWAEKLKSIPARQESRESSEDPLGGSVYGPDSDDENGKLERTEVLSIADMSDENRIAGYQSQITELEGKIARIRSQQAQRRASRPKKSKKAGPSQPRKQSTARASPTYGNGTAKKPRKSRDVGYREDDDDEIVEISSHQKEVLAEKIQSADPETLNKALEIIARTQNVASVSYGSQLSYRSVIDIQDGEIELDIEALPPRAVYELYTVVVGPLKKSRKSNYVPNGRKPGRRPGGARKSMNEAEEQERIARMEAQLQSFGDSGRVQATAGYDDNDSESSEEEDSDLD
jgi:bromodomain-containing factor 1